MVPTNAQFDSALIQPPPPPPPPAQGTAQDAVPILDDSDLGEVDRDLLIEVLELQCAALNCTVKPSTITR